MPKNWKETLIVLIPKVHNASEMSKFRPIILCQTIYKMVAGMILNKLKFCLPSIILEEQDAFILGRTISDNCLMAQEVINKLKFSKAKSGFMLIKLDMEQIYDSMCWATLIQILRLMRFLENIVNLIFQCVIHPKFSIIMNGNYCE
ncbi:hypothetical protein KFK09_000650 [Dendrobium nobile]|uniref:Reverse transcriptase domain-containing protein n=1 Tax=Dendrobium nobile TaxID=94219 RepID=A0A8T3C968_DENNO|nr:hypothetical protein KFK09_000650 [Dendrobium nobile]